MQIRWHRFYHWNQLKILSYISNLESCPVQPRHGLNSLQEFPFIPCTCCEREPGHLCQSGRVAFVRKVFENFAFDTFGGAYIFIYNNFQVDFQVDSYRTRLGNMVPMSLQFTCFWGPPLTQCRWHGKDLVFFGLFVGVVHLVWLAGWCTDIRHIWYVSVVNLGMAQCLPMAVNSPDMFINAVGMPVNEWPEV